MTEMKFHFTTVKKKKKGPLSIKFMRIPKKLCNCTLFRIGQAPDFVYFMLCIVDILIEIWRFTHSYNPIKCALFHAFRWKLKIKALAAAALCFLWRCHYVNEFVYNCNQIYIQRKYDSEFQPKFSTFFPPVSWYQSPVLWFQSSCTQTHLYRNFRE